MPHNKRHGTRRRRGDGGCVSVVGKAMRTRSFLPVTLMSGREKDGDGIVLSRTRLIAMFFLSTKEDTGNRQGVSFPQEYSQRMKAWEWRAGVGEVPPTPHVFLSFLFCANLFSYLQKNQ